MFNSGFKEASENTARLPEDDPDAFDMLVNWVYFGNIKCLETNVYPDGSEAMSWDPIAFYSLAEKICLPEIQDRIRDAMIKHHKKKDELPSIDFVHRAYTQTSSRSEMRSYALQGLQYVLSLGVKTKDAWPTAQMEKLFKDHHASFSLDFLAVLREEDTEDRREEHRCVFHGHKMEEPCSADTTVKKSKRKANETLGHASKRSRIETPVSPDASQHS